MVVIKYYNGIIRDFTNVKAASNAIGLSPYFVRKAIDRGYELEDLGIAIIVEVDETKRLKTTN